MKKVILVQMKNSYNINDDVNDQAFDEDSTKTKYSYFTNIEDIAVGNMLVADSVHGLKFVQVVQVDGLEQTQLDRAETWIISRLDIDAHRENVINQRKAQEIMNKIDAAAKKVERLAILQHLGTTNPDIAALMNELHGIDPAMMPANLLPAPVTPTVTEVKVDES